MRGRNFRWRHGVSSSGVSDSGATSGIFTVVSDAHFVAGKIFDVIYADNGSGVDVRRRLLHRRHDAGSAVISRTDSASFCVFEKKSGGGGGGF